VHDRQGDRVGQRIGSGSCIAAQRRFKTAEAQKACTKQGQGIATRVTKSGASVDVDRTKAEDREQSRSLWI
jgi:hypothetical protein